VVQRSFVPSTQLKLGSVIVLDNATFYRKKALKKLVALYYFYRRTRSI